ncbi:Peptidase OS=Streptomyces fumanus OX=67302 GN=GCM10018772_47910 PE=4 SV=1 [Streptomyces fumanus]
MEEHHLTVARHLAMRSVAPRLRLADLGGAVEQLRVVKDEEEISCLRIGAEIADQALGELLESILVGRTERHLALELERRLVDHGADGPAFPTSVGTGPNSGRPGHRPTDRRVEEADFLSVCLGATYRGYRCEIGRTFVIGTSPADWQIELYDLVFAAQRAGLEALVPGASCR